MNRCNPGRVMTAVLLLLAARPALAEDELRVEARLEPAVIGIEETATLTFEARTNGPDNPGFRPDFEFENLQIVAGPIRGEDVSFVNGAISHAFRISFRVRPLSIGRGRVHSIAQVRGWLACRRSSVGRCTGTNA